MAVTNSNVGGLRVPAGGRPAAGRPAASIRFIEHANSWGGSGVQTLVDARLRLVLVLDNTGLEGLTVATVKHVASVTGGTNVIKRSSATEL